MTLQRKGPKTLDVVHGWKIQRSTIPGNYNLTHETTGAKSGKIAGMVNAVRFAAAHPDGKVERVKIGGKLYSKPPEPPKPEVPKCPKCGQEYDPKNASIYECPRCGAEGSSSCCNPGGRGCICIACETGEEP